MYTTSGFKAPSILTYASLKSCCRAVLFKVAELPLVVSDGHSAGLEFSHSDFCRCRF